MLTPIERAEQNAVVSGMKKRARELGKFQVTRAFETAGCSCTPIRQEQEQLSNELALESEAYMEPYHKKVEVARQRFQEAQETMRAAQEQFHVDRSEAYDTLDKLRREIRERDRQEHGGLDIMARQAEPYLLKYMVQEYRAGNTAVATAEDVATQFALAWIAGWRP